MKYNECVRDGEEIAFVCDHCSLSTLPFADGANDDVIGYPGEPRDIDLYEEDSLGSIPSGDEESFEIEISDDPLPVSYWLTIDDR